MSGWAYYAVKVLVSAVLVVAVSEIAKRSSLFGAIVASIPLTSVLAFVWLYVDTADGERIAALSLDIFWLVIPSLILFLVLAWLLHRGVAFWLSLPLSIAATAGGYGVTLWLLKRLSSA